MIVKINRDYFPVFVMERKFVFCEEVIQFCVILMKLKGFNGLISGAHIHTRTSELMDR
jgi:hypothetical protein